MVEILEDNLTIEPDVCTVGRDANDADNLLWPVEVVCCSYLVFGLTGGFNSDDTF